jgi:ribose 5-phosphate isomerase A
VAPDEAHNDQAKKAAAIAAASLVQSGMIVGLGTGSTAKFAVDELGRRMREEGLRFVGVPTSEATAKQARELGIPLSTLGEHPSLDLAIDGADEIVEGPLHLVKGRGGALLREKIVEASAKELIIIADESKMVAQLGTKMPLPVEVNPFGWEATAQRLRAIGATPVLRECFTTDGGHIILDCAFEPISDPLALQRQLDSTVGVVEHGLFLGMATQAFVATANGMRHLRRTID